MLRRRRSCRGIFGRRQPAARGPVGALELVDRLHRPFLELTARHCRSVSSLAKALRRGPSSSAARPCRPCSCRRGEKRFSSRLLGLASGASSGAVAANSDGALAARGGRCGAAGPGRARRATATAGTRRSAAGSRPRPRQEIAIMAISSHEGDSARRHGPIRSELCQLRERSVPRQRWVKRPLATRRRDRSPRIRSCGGERGEHGQRTHVARQSRPGRRQSRRGLRSSRTSRDARSLQWSAPSASDHSAPAAFRVCRLCRRAAARRSRTAGRPAAAGPRRPHRPTETARAAAARRPPAAPARCPLMPRGSSCARDGAQPRLAPAAAAGVQLLEPLAPPGQPDRAERRLGRASPPRRPAPGRGSTRRRRRAGRARRQ